MQSSMPSMPDVCADPKFGLVVEMLRCHGTVYLKALGTSMLPSVWPGDLLTIQSAKHDEVSPGDIVLILRNSRFFVHRLVEMRRNQDGLLWITRGDALPRNDPPEASSELLGRVAGIRRGNRSFVPIRRVSRFHSAAGWTLRRWDRFRNPTLRIRAAILQAHPSRAAVLLSRAFGALRGILGVSPPGTSHP
jgi:hypothetical protein